MLVVRRMHEHHCEQQDEEDEHDRPEYRMPTSALEDVPEPDHERGMLPN